MDTDFINKYIQRQSQLITELTGKNLMVEVKLQMLEERYNELAAQHQALVESVERARLAAEEQARIALEQETLKQKTPKKHTTIKQPSETDFVEEERQHESQF